MNDVQLLKQYHDKITKKDDLQIHRITNNLVDVFQGDGWDKCSRYRKVKNKWVQVSGPQLTFQQLLLLADNI